MEILAVLAGLSFVAYIGFNSLCWLYWIQDKEYRADRFLVFAKSSEVFREMHVVPKLALCVVVFIFWLFGYTALAMVVSLTVLNSIFVYKLGKHVLRRPVFTQRAVRILATTFILVIPLEYIIYSNYGYFFSFIGVDPIILLGMSVGVYWTGIISQNIKEKEKILAIEKLSKYSPTVIGITGSYGKTTTKEFLYTVVAQKFNVVKNDGSQNTEFGVVRAVNKYLTQNKDVLILEMGAYRKGEIAKISSFARPQIAIITGIDVQHLELFGSLKNIIQAKTEVVESLPESTGVAIFNLNNNHCENLYEKYKKEGKFSIYGYKLTTKIGKDNNIQYLRVVKAEVGRIRFESVLGKMKDEYTVNVPMPVFLQNVAAAILTANILGLKRRDIQRGLDVLAMPEKTMNFIKLRSGSVVIDDSFNSNPKGFENALKLLASSSSPRIVITTGIIELGIESDRVHKRIGKLMQTTADKVFLRNATFERSIKTGLGKLSEKLSVVDDVNDLTKAFEGFATISGNTILLEGKLPKKIFELLESLKV